MMHFLCSIDFPTIKGTWHEVPLPGQTLVAQRNALPGIVAKPRQQGRLCIYSRQLPFGTPPAGAELTELRIVFPRVFTGV